MGANLTVIFSNPKEHKKRDHPKRAVPQKALILKVKWY